MATQSVLFTAVCTPYNALNALITKNQYERGVLGATNVVGNLLAQILVNTFMLRLVSFFGNNQAAWILATTVFAILGFTAHMLCFSNTYERSAGDPKEVSPKFSVSLRSLAHNRYWIIVTISQTLLSIMNTLQLSSAVYFATGVVHNSNAIAGLTNTMNIGQLVTILLSFIYLKKIGKGSSVRIGYSAVVITYIIQIFVGGNYTALMILGVLRGLGMGMGSACFGGILSDTVEYGEWKTHVRTVGMTNASNSFSQKVGGGLGTATVGWLIAAAGYQAGAAVQNAATITALNTLFTYIPLVCAAIVVILMGYYKLDKFYPQIISDLNDRHASSKQA